MKEEKYMPDILWKELITDLFEDFMYYFMSDMAKEIDFSRRYEFLDKELANIREKKQKDRRYADLLVKVWLKSGEEKWVLIHIEIQGYHDYESEFSERMFTYYYRIYDKYKKELTAIALFTDKDRKYKPNKYTRNFYGTKVNYEYNIYKVLEQKEEKLKKEKSPFALVVLAGLYTLKTEGKSKAAQRYKFKKNLIKILRDRGWEKEKIIKMFIFIDKILSLPEELELKFEKETEKGGEGNMGITIEMSQLYQIVEKRGEKRGKREGKMELLKNLLGAGFNKESLLKASGLSKKELEELE